MSDWLPISVIMLTQDEEANIAACLRSVAAWAGEIYVVDSGSTDRTVEIAGQFTPNVVVHPFENYSRQRNWAQQALPLRFDWVFHIDADERVSPELAASLQRLFTGRMVDRLDGLMVSRRTVFLGRPILHGDHYPAYHLRIFRRDKGRCEDRLYDQHYVVNGATQTVPGDLIDVITADLTEWVKRHARWGALEAAEQLRTHGDGSPNQVRGRALGTPIERRRWLRSSVYGRGPLFLRAFAYFLYRYVVRLGFLDGTEGLMFHFLQGCWYRFYVDAKIWEARHRSALSTGRRPEAAAREEAVR